MHLVTAVTASNELAGAVLTAALPIVWALDTTSADTLTLARIPLPEERPAIRTLVRHLLLCWRSAGICRTGAVWCTVARIVLVIGSEDCKGLLFGCACVVAAFSSLNGCRDLGGAAFKVCWADAFAV